MERLPRTERTRDAFAKAHRCVSRRAESLGRPAGAVAEGDYVIFCISCSDGPTEVTLQPVVECAGRTIVPLAIVPTHYIDDDSLRSLVTLEERELLSRILPSEEGDRLPVLYAFDPGWS